MKLINTRGLSCPEPVLLTKKALDENPKELEVLVDTGAPKNNVSRFLKNSGYKVDLKDDTEGFIIHATK